LYSTTTFLSHHIIVAQLMSDFGPLCSVSITFYCDNQGHHHIFAQFLSIATQVEKFLKVFFTLQSYNNLTPDTHHFPTSRKFPCIQGNTTYIMIPNFSQF